MSFATQFKKSPIFRVKIMVIIVIFILLYNSEKKEIIAPIGIQQLIPSDTDEACLARGGRLQRDKVMIGSRTCVTCVEDGYYAAKEDYEAYPEVGYPYNICCSNNFLTVDDISSIPGNQIGIKCVPYDPETACSSKEQPIARIIRDIGLFKNNCKAAYFTAIFGGAILLLIVFSIVF